MCANVCVFAYKEIKIIIAYNFLKNIQTRKNVVKCLKYSKIYHIQPRILYPLKYSTKIQEKQRLQQTKWMEFVAGRVTSQNTFLKA